MSSFTVNGTVINPKLWTSYYNSEFQIFKHKMRCFD